MKAVVILVATCALAGFIGWQMVSEDDQPQPSSDDTPANAPAPIQNPQQLEEQLYRAVGLRMQTQRTYRWSEIESLIDICTMTPCQNGMATPASTATLRIALVRNGWFDIDTSTPDAVWSHDGLSP